MGHTGTGSSLKVRILRTGTSKNFLELDLGLGYCLTRPFNDFVAFLTHLNLSLRPSRVQATSICFQEKTIYTMEVLTIVLQQLMEQKVRNATV